MKDKGELTQRYHPGSILLSDQIESFIKKGILIVDNTFDEQQLRTAKYNVRLGKMYFKGDEYHSLDDKNPILKIEPYELVFIESYEVFRLPENMVGQYDIRISGCLGGMGLQTGLQLDPTYFGRIFCPLFNFSNKTLTLRYKKHFASVQFIYTTPPAPETKRFESERQGLLSLNQALPDEPGRSGLEELGRNIKETQGQLEKRIEDFDRAATRLHTRVDAMVSAVFEGMAFMIAALGILVAAISIVIIPEFKVGAPTDMSRIITIGIGVAIFIGVALVIFLLIRRIMRKISGDTKISKG